MQNGPCGARFFMQTSSFQSRLMAQALTEWMTWLAANARIRAYRPTAQV